MTSLIKVLQDNPIYILLLGGILFFAVSSAIFFKRDENLNR